MKNKNRVFPSVAGNGNDFLAVITGFVIVYDDGGAVQDLTSQG
jgi:hypothetical protein